MTPEEQAQVMEWQPIDTAPKDGTPVLLAFGGITVLGWWEGESRYPWRIVDEFEVDDSDRAYINAAMGHVVSHWMPLPPPPQDAERRQ